MKKVPGKLIVQVYSGGKILRGKIIKFSKVINLDQGFCLKRQSSVYILVIVEYFALCGYFIVVAIYIETDRSKTTMATLFRSCEKI